MTITADSLMLRPKVDYDVGYDVAMKGLSVVVWDRLESRQSSMAEA